MRIKIELYVDTKDYSEAQIQELAKWLEEAVEEYDPEASASAFIQH